MEARKRGTMRESTDEFDLEASKGLEQGTMPYINMAVDPVGGPVTTGTGEDSHLRSLTKGLTWRFIASGTTIVIAKIVTGETTIAFQIGFIEFFAKIGIYYVHERIWAKIKI